MTATGDLRFACACGRVAGTVANVSPMRGDHIVCHCTDCQSFALHLECADRVLDRHGGTALYQSRCGDVCVMQGKEQLAALHLTEQSTLRWYAACCNTPMFNTFANGRVPFTSILLANCDPAACATMGEARGDLFLKDAIGDTSRLEPMPMARLMRRVIVRMAKDMISGARRHNALFDAKSFAPIAPAHRLGVEQRLRLNQLVKQYHGGKR